VSAAACGLHIPEGLGAVGLASVICLHDMPGVTAGTDPQALQMRDLARATLRAHKGCVRFQYAGSGDGSVKFQTAQVLQRVLAWGRPAT